MREKTHAELIAKDYSMMLVYSPYDKSWYWQRYSDWKVSQLFSSKRKAIQAVILDELTWE